MHSIDDLRSELRRAGEALIERLRPEFQALRQEMGGIRTQLQRALPSPSLRRVEVSEAEITTTDSYFWFKDPAARVWHISVPPNPTQVFHVADCVGLAYIQAILRVAPNELSPSQVQALAANDTALSLFARGSQSADRCVDEDGQEGNVSPNYETLQLPFDERTKRQVGERLNFVREELEKAERNNDQAQETLLRYEKEQLLEYLNDAMGKHKRLRQMSSDGGHARDAVRQGIKRAIVAISKINSTAAEFLRTHIRVGWKLSYAGPEVRWRFHK